MEPSANKVPRHIGIILDGNRRFSKRLMLKPWKGHEWGAKKVEALFDWCKEIGIKELTLYAFSYENFNRPKHEFDYLMKLFKKEFTRLLHDERIYKEKIRINFIGRIQMFDKELHEIMKSLMKATKTHSNRVVNFAMAYSGRIEIIDAVKKIAEKAKKGDVDVNEINEQLFSKNLYLKDEPDMVIRTGGEKRLSNFLPYQSVYSELFFVDKLWPEFEKKDLILTIKEFNKRDRRFGK